MGDWIIEGNIVRRSGGGPFANFTESYQWTGERWEYQHRSEDRAPGAMVPSCEPDVVEDALQPINTQEAIQLLQVYGLTSLAIPIDEVLTTSPGRLEELASQKQ